MTYRQGYFAMFYLLSEYYFENKNNDDLAVMLGSMNPEMYEDSETVGIDPAYWADWKRILEESEVAEPMNTEDLLDIIIAFLKFYQREFEFNLNEVLEKVQELSKRSELLIKCINLAKDK